MRYAVRPARLVIAAGLGLLALFPGLLSAEGDSPDRTIRLYQRMVRRNPLDARTYYRLGDAYIQKARQSGDVTYFNLAEQALRKALVIAPQYGNASRHLAFVLYSRHEFEGAAAEARRAIELDPTDSHAEGILGDALLEVGQYEEAEQAYQRMIHLRRDLYSYSRLAGLKNLRGDTTGAIEDLARAIRAGRDDGAPKESIAWALWQLAGDHLALGHLKEADAHYVEAGTTFPGYHRALAGLGAVRIGQRRYDEAIELYQKAIGVVPLPEYVTALGDLQTTLGRTGEAEKQYRLLEYIGYLNELNKILYNRELASFYADHDLKLEAALHLAQREFEVRRDIYAHDLLAWALYKNGRAREAVAPMREALRLGTRDARLFFHAGMIHHQLGEAERAKEYLRRALATNPHFHILHAETAARTLEQIERADAR